MIFDKFLSLLPSELDGALIMSEENRRYFTSFPSSDGVLLISRNGTVFLTDSRYVEAAQKKITVCPVRLTKDLRGMIPVTWGLSNSGLLVSYSPFDLLHLLSHPLPQIVVPGL